MNDQWRGVNEPSFEAAYAGVVRYQSGRLRPQTLTGAGARSQELFATAPLAKMSRESVTAALSRGGSWRVNGYLWERRVASCPKHGVRAAKRGGAGLCAVVKLVNFRPPTPARRGTKKNANVTHTMDTVVTRRRVTLRPVALVG
jgi:hypothetical protein